MRDSRSIVLQRDGVEGAGHQIPFSKQIAERADYAARDKEQAWFPPLYDRQHTAEVGR